jgi:hypothetical protein
MGTAFDLSHVKSVSVLVLLHPDHPGIAGRIVANHSDNPAGSVCTATTHVFGGPLHVLPGITGKAGGYGYDKLSSAVASSINAIRKAKSIEYRTEEEVAKVRALPDARFGGVGESGIAEWFKQYGYRLERVV